MPLLVGTSLGSTGALITLSKAVCEVLLTLRLVIYPIKRPIRAPGMSVPILHTDTRLLPQAVYFKVSLERLFALTITF